MTKVEIYTTKYCPYCIRAKNLLDKKDIAYIEYKVDEEKELYGEMIARAKGTSVPQIFINDQHIGGCDDMFMLEMDDELDPLLYTEKSNEE